MSFILPRLTLNGILVFNSVSLCLIAITRNSLVMIIIEDNKNRLDSNVLDNNMILTTTKSLSVIIKESAKRCMLVKISGN